MSEGKQATREELLAEIGNKYNCLNKVYEERNTAQAKNYRQRQTIKKMRKVISTLRTRLAEKDAEIEAMKCSGNCSKKSDTKLPCEGAWRFLDKCPCIWWELKER